MNDAAVLQIRHQALFTDADIAIIANAICEVRSFDPRTTLIRAHTPVDISMLLLDGIMSRYVEDRQGLRQLVGIQFSGDFVDLHAYPLKMLDHDVGTITAARVACVPHERLHDIQHGYPDLAHKLWRLTLLDAAQIPYWVFRLGRLKAVERVAHFLLETSCRLSMGKLGDPDRFDLPLTQNDLGEVCGLTSVHVNRVMRELRDAALVTFRSGTVVIHDRATLTQLGGFNPDYLYVDAGSRVASAAL